MVLIPRICPVAWRVYVQGDGEIRRVRETSQELNLQTSEPQQELHLVDPPLYSLVVRSEANAPLTREEIVAILGQVEEVKLDFPAAQCPSSLDASC